MKYDLTYISLGAGVQSSAMLICSALGLHDVPRADVAIFADTGDEPQFVYDQLDRLANWSKGQGIPVQVVKFGDGTALSEVMQHRWVPIPAFTRSENYKKLSVEDVAGEFELTVGAKKKPRIREDGRLRRQCTNEMKIRPIEQEARRLLGYQFGEVVKKRARALIGISCDEASRAKPSQTRWIDKAFPLIDAGLYRPHCIRLVEEHGFGTPQKSACVYCPFHSDRYWASLKRDHPEEFERACRVDDMIRNKATRKELDDQQMADEIFIHRSLVPLRQVEFGDQPELWDEECAGVCGV